MKQNPLHPFSPLQRVDQFIQLFAMDCISLWVGGSLTVRPSVLSGFVLLLVPLMALLSRSLVTSPGGPWDPSQTLGADVTDEGHLVPTGMMDRGRDALRA